MAPEPNKDSFAAGLVGIVLDGRYRLDALLGEGGMGAVFRAHHLATDRRVAVKLLKPHLTTDDAALERFAREARSTLRVDSPHAVKVLDFGITPGPQRDYYMALEYIDGRTVQRELEVDGPFAPARVVHIARQALHALGAAHAQGLVHRDIKPDNIILTQVGDDADYAKLLDFGVAKLLEGAARSDRSRIALTMKGVVFGTCEFMAPEQACGKAVDARSDLYSLAATMFGMLTGRGMYQADTPMDWLMHHVRTPAPHLKDGLPELAAYPELDALLQRCLAKHREQRPESAEEMARLLAELEPSLHGRSVPEVQTAATIVPGNVMRPQASTWVETIPPEEGLEAPRRIGRGWWYVAGAMAVAAVVVTAIVLATRDREPRKPAAGSAQLPPATGSGPPATANVPIDAGVVVDAVVANAVVAPHVVDAGVEKRPMTELKAHLAAAEAAKASGNRLRQIAEADAALRVDPHSVQAKLLIADGLIATGSNDSGCRYLRGLGRNPTARSLMTKASCPSD